MRLLLGYGLVINNNNNNKWMSFCDLSTYSIKIRVFTTEASFARFSSFFQI